MSLGGVLRRIGNFNPEGFSHDFDQRLILQKTIYLLQAFGLYLGYPFSWYIRGPYSPELANDAFTLCKAYEKSSSVRFGNLESERRFLRFAVFLNRPTDASWLERLASIHFLRHVYPSRSKDEIIGKVMAKQRYFSRNECEEAWAYLEKNDLL